MVLIVLCELWTNSFLTLKLTPRRHQLLFLFNEVSYPLLRAAIPCLIQIGYLDKISDTPVDTDDEDKIEEKS